MERRTITGLGCLLWVSVLFSCAAQPYEDGTYRGSFIDKGYIEVSVQFSLKNGVVEKASFRYLKAGEPIAAAPEVLEGIDRQYQELLDYLVGKNLNEYLADLYNPGDIISTEVDGYSGATVRSSKVISAIRDGLNRGVYSY